MRTIFAISNKIKNRPDIWFFFGFILFFSFSIRKVWFYFPIQGTFNEYTGIYVYISDILLAATLLSWLLILLNNNKHLLSNIPTLKPTIGLGTCGQPRNGDLSTSSHSFFSLNKKDSVLMIPALFVFLAFSSIIWSENRALSIYRFLRLAELFFLYIYIIKSFIPYFVNSDKLFHVEQLKIALKYFRAILLGFIFIMLFDHYFWDIWQGQVLFWMTCAFISGLYCSTWNNYQEEKILITDDIAKNEIVPRGTISSPAKILMILIMIIGAVNALLAFIQISAQRSLGLFWLKESIISPNIPGVAKIIINHTNFIRAYGFMPHPNIFGGFLLFSIIITLLYKKLFHVEQFERKSSKEKPASAIISESKMSLTSVMRQITIVPRGTIIINTVVFLQTIALLLTVSKSAIIGLALALLFINVPRRTLMKISLAIIGITMIMFTFKFDLHSLFIKSLEERGLYLNVSRGTISTHPILGVGMGEFIDNFYKTISNLPNWQYQPVHNVFLLAYSELGIFGFILLTLFLISLFAKKID